MRLTADQRMVLRHVRATPGMTGDEAAEDFVGGRGKWSYDRAHASLKRLEKRDLVRRGGVGTTKWFITDAGSAALDG